MYCTDVYVKDAPGDKPVADIAELMLPHIGARAFSKYLFASAAKLSPNPPCVSVCSVSVHYSEHHLEAPEATTQRYRYSISYERKLAPSTSLRTPHTHSLSISLDRPLSSTLTFIHTDAGANTVEANTNAAQRAAVQVGHQFPQGRRQKIYVQSG